MFSHNFLFSIPLWLLLLMSPVRLDLMGKGLSTYKKMEVEVLSLKFGQAGWGRLVHRRVL